MHKDSSKAILHHKEVDAKTKSSKCASDEDSSANPTKNAKKIIIKAKKDLPLSSMTLGANPEADKIEVFSQEFLAVLPSTTYKPQKQGESSVGTLLKNLSPSPEKPLYKDRSLG